MACDTKMFVVMDLTLRVSAFRLMLLLLLLSRFRSVRLCATP